MPQSARLKQYFTTRYADVELLSSAVDLLGCESEGRRFNHRISRMIFQDVCATSVR